mgnify:CR=1 FL=1|jgi:hypothetical protein
MSATRIPAVPIRNPMSDDDGRTTRPWALFFEQLVGVLTGLGGAVTSSVPSGIETMTVSGATVTPDLSKGWTHEFHAVAPFTLAAPVNVVPGATFVITIYQDYAAAVMSFDSFYRGVRYFSHDTTAATYAALMFQVSADGTYAQLLQVPINGNPSI